VDWQRSLGHAAAQGQQLQAEQGQGQVGLLHQDSASYSEQGQQQRCCSYHLSRTGSSNRWQLHLTAQPSQAAQTAPLHLGFNRPRLSWPAGCLQQVWCLPGCRGAGYACSIVGSGRGAFAAVARQKDGASHAAAQGTLLSDTGLHVAIGRPGRCSTPSSTDLVLSSTANTPAGLPRRAWAW